MRLIDADKMQEDLYSLCNKYNISFGGNYDSFGSEIAAIVKNQPTVDSDSFVKHDNKEKIIKALASCSELCCGECPYQHLDDKTYTMRCIHVLIQDVYELLKENQMVL